MSCNSIPSSSCIIKVLKAYALCMPFSCHIANISRCCIFDLLLCSSSMNAGYYFPPSSSSSLQGQMFTTTSTQGNRNGARAVALALAMRISRARWYGFLRRVFQYQNGPRSDLVSNPFNSGPWLVLELMVLVAQMMVITVTMVVSQHENPVWPLRIWVAGYNLGVLVSLPLLYWRYLHSNVGQTSGLRTDLEQQRAGEESRDSYLMNKSRTFLELFFAIWFVMGNVWVFDWRYGSFGRAPRLHVLCITLLAWNAIAYSFPFLLFLLLCCFVPCMSRLLGYNMNVASDGRGASDDLIATLPHCKFKELGHKHELAAAHDSPECCICLAKYRDREEVRQLPCLHLFHLQCVDQWLRIISCCPLCKQELEK